MININDQIEIIRDLAEEYKLSEKGWKIVPNIQIFKASQYENFDIVVAIVFSPLLNQRKKKKYESIVYTLFKDFDSRSKLCKLSELFQKHCYIDNCQ